MMAVPKEKNNYTEQTEFVDGANKIFYDWEFSFKKIY